LHTNLTVCCRFWTAGSHWGVFRPDPPFLTLFWKIHGSNVIRCQILGTPVITCVYLIFFHIDSCRRRCPCFCVVCVFILFSDNVLLQQSTHFVIEIALQHQTVIVRQAVGSSKGIITLTYSAAAAALLCH